MILLMKSLRIYTICTKFARISNCIITYRVDSVRQSTIANFLVIGGFAAFAFVVQYVLQTIAAAND